MRSAFINPGVITAVAILAVGAGGLGAVKSYWDMYTQKLEIRCADDRLVSSVPFTTPSWARVGIDQLEEAETLAVLGTQNYVTRTYVERTPKNPEKTVRLTFHATYYTGGIDAVPHVPDRCFVGGGMQIGELVGNLPLKFDQSMWSVNEDVPESRKGQVWRVRVTNPDSASDGRTPNLPYKPQEMRLRTMKFLQGERAVYSGYFFIANGGSVAMPEEVRLLAFDLQSKYAYYMKVQVTSADVESGEELAAAASSLIGEMLGDIMLCVPDWVEVEAGRYPPQAALTVDGKP